VGEG
jgi:hypothetical protein